MLKSIVISTLMFFCPNPRLGLNPNLTLGKKQLFGSQIRKHGPAETNLAVDLSGEVLVRMQKELGRSELSCDLGRTDRQNNRTILEARWLSAVVGLAYAQ